MTTIYNKEQVDAQAVLVGQAIKEAKTKVTQVTGQSITEAVSQKLLTDEVTNTNDRVSTLESVSGKFKNVLDNAVISIWIGTQAELDAVAVKSDAVMYMVKA